MNSSEGCSSSLGFKVALEYSEFYIFFCLHFLILPSVFFSHLYFPLLSLMHFLAFLFSVIFLLPPHPSPIYFPFQLCR